MIKSNSVDTSDNHFPYKYDAAIEAGIMPELAAVSRDLVNAQEKYRNNPSDSSLQTVRRLEKRAQWLSSEYRNERPAPVIVAEQNPES